MKGQLIALGIPADEIAFIHDAPTDRQKESLFDDMRSGNKRVLIGSTQKCGAGTNIQKRLIALHHLDCPWRPSDIEQREGRILRQGNRNKAVHIYRYITKKSFDAYLWQLVEQKQRFIAQIMSGKVTGRVCKDVDEATLSFAEVKAIATGDPHIREKMVLEQQIEQLKLLQQEHNKNLCHAQDMMSAYPTKLATCRNAIDAMTKDCIALSTSKGAPFQIEVAGKHFTERVPAGERLLAMIPQRKAFPIGASAELGTCRGLTVSVLATLDGNKMKLEGNYRYYFAPSKSAIGIITKMENTVEEIGSDLIKMKEKMQLTEENMEQTHLLLEKPFEQSDEMEETAARLVELDAEMNLRNGQADTVDQNAEQEPDRAEFDQAPPPAYEPETY